MNFHWRWRWWERIQAILLNLFYFNNTSRMLFGKKFHKRGPRSKQSYNWGFQTPKSCSFSYIFVHSFGAAFNQGFPTKMKLSNQARIYELEDCYWIQRLLAQTSAHYQFWYKPCLHMLICFWRTRKLFFTSNQKNELSQLNKTYIDISNDQFELCLICNS